MTKKEKRLLENFVLSGYKADVIGIIEKRCKYNDEFKRAYEYIINERVFSKSYTSPNTKISSIYKGGNAMKVAE